MTNSQYVILIYIILIVILLVILFKIYNKIIERSHIRMKKVLMDKIAKNQKVLAQNWIKLSEGKNDIEDKLNLTDSQRIIDLALAELSEQKQTIFNLSRLQDKKHEEIAEIVGLSKSRVKNVIVEVLKHIRYKLNKETLFVFVCSVINFTFFR